MIASRFAVVLIVLTIPGCGRPSRLSLDDAALRYVRLAVALGERDPDSLDFYAGPADLVADQRRNPLPLPEIKREAETLSARVLREAPADPAGAARARDLVADLTAMVARVNLLTGTRLPYDKERVVFFGITSGPLDEHRLSDIRSQIADIVGRDGRLVDRYSAFAVRFTIDADRLPAVMNAAIDECRRRTVAHLALPAGERVTLEFVRDKPWSAFSRYFGDARSAIQINTDFRFTVDQALQVACHEGYPGHHTRNALMAPTSTPVARDVSPAGHYWPERSVQLMFSPEALVSEASAMLAADVAFSPAERVGVERDRLFPLAGLDPSGAEQHIAIERLVGDLQVVQDSVARRDIDGELEFSRAVAALEEQALVPHAEALMKYVNEYRSYVTTYTTGRTIFAAQLAACAGAHPTADERWRCFEHEMLKR